MGVQATLATAHMPGDGIQLYDLLAGMSADPAAHADDPAREVWEIVSAMFRKKLGFDLEPELFSNMLFVAVLGGFDHPAIAPLVRHCLAVFRDTAADGLYHFFLSLGFSCDLDCTGMATRARLAAGDLDLEQEASRATLRSLTSRILRSAATSDRSAEENSSHGKANGPLTRWVFKVYPDDHTVHPPALDRGLKNNPVVAVNCLYGVLWELRAGLRDPGERIALAEFFDGEDAPRTGEATVAEIVAANVRFVAEHLTSGRWTAGCRYYASPDAFLCFYSECVREFPEVFEALDAGAQRVGLAVASRRGDPSTTVAANPRTSLNAAFRAIAGTNVGMDSSFERAVLLSQQDDDGAWRDPDCLYTLGTDTQVHFRSPILTTAFALAALSDDESSGVRARPSIGSRAASATWAEPIVARLRSAPTGS